ncbi:hypothetical protein L1887_10114 [Cichorium endivia]|nr:hypothetical protein L1887_10114 [Cichorium endivia]
MLNFKRRKKKSGNEGREVIKASKTQKKREMADWAPVLIGVLLFVLLTPGLLFQLPGKGRAVEFNNMQTSGVSICVHTIIFFGMITILLIAVGISINIG